MAGQGSLVKKSCSCCERYKGHLRGKMASFLMLMSPNYRHSMTMPPRFMNQFGGEISESIDIESPYGSVYAVKGTKYMNKMLPQCGWKEFVDAHPIEVNDWLLFQHIEKTRFKVLIIDPDGCEKVCPCDGIRISASSIQGRDTDYVDVSDSSHDCTNKLSRVRKRVSSCQGDCPSQRRKVARITKTSVSSSEESGPDSEGTAEYEWSSGFDDDPKTNAAHDYVLSRMSILSEEQEEQVVGLVKDIQPKTTVFVAVMKPNNVQPYHSLVIPHGYASHFPHKSQVVTLQRSGKNKKWHAKLRIRKDRTAAHIRFTGPWSDFVKDNHLQEGDICIFQPLKTSGTRFNLMVHLIRQSKLGAVHEHGNSPSPGLGGGTSSSRGRTTETKANEAKTVHSVEGNTKEKLTPEASSPCNYNCHVTDDKSGNSGGTSEAGRYIMASHAHLTNEQWKKVEDIVGNIQSQVPIYVAVMNKTNVASKKTSFYFGKQYTNKYLPHGEHTVTLVRNEKSAAWKVKLHARIFSKGWRHFVCDNHLKLDDICLFQLTKDDIKTLTMKVYIIRNVTKVCAAQGTGESRPDIYMSREWDFCDMDDRHNYFFKVMSGDFQSRMIIPNKFAKRFQDKIPGQIKLKASNGSTSTVVVTRYLDKLVLEAGWEEFVRTNDIRLCDFLVFRYNANFQFEVLIFGPSCCVKESSNVSENICDRVLQRHRDLIGNSSDSDNDHRPKKSPGSDEEPTRNKMKGSNQCTKINRSPSTSDLNASGCVDISSSEDDEEIPSGTKYIFSPSTHLTQMQRMKVEKRLQDVCSRTPIFGCVMTKCNITRNPCYLGFYRKYASQYLPSKKQILRLQQNGKVWEVLFRITKRNLTGLAHGWKEFVGDNKLQMGDICLFELLKNQKMLTMNIHIIRK